MKDENEIFCYSKVLKFLKLGRDKAIILRESNILRFFHKKAGGNIHYQILKNTVEEFRNKLFSPDYPDNFTEQEKEALFQVYGYAESNSDSIYEKWLSKKFNNN